VMWGAAIAAIGFVLPMVELTNVNGDPVGMAIRGYGVMLLCGVVSAVALAAWRASRRGIDPDVIFAIAPWAFIGGIVGARLFYVIQYWDNFDTYADMIKFTEGGLVVYGSFIGGTIAGSYYIIRHRLPLLKFGDVIIPCLFIGVFFGRIGCLMNGCCYGGRCEDNWAAIHFPPTSQVYQQQLRSGELLGMQVDPGTDRIEAVSPNTLASEAGIEVGSTLRGIDYVPPAITEASLKLPAANIRPGVVATVDHRQHSWTPEQLPARALPVYAAQLLSSLSSLALCLLLCGLSLVFKRDGAIMMIGFASYAVLRFVLELVRVDEGGQFGTGLTISQWVSVVVFALSIVGLAFVYLKGPTSNAVQAQPSAL
jgi:phosphatidylglycerol:prolipoprotein diacylglycerol transferase